MAPTTRISRIVFHPEDHSVTINGVKVPAIRFRTAAKHPCARQRLHNFLSSFRPQHPKFRLPQVTWSTLRIWRPVTLAPSPKAPGHVTVPDKFQPYVAQVNHEGPARNHTALPLGRTGTLGIGLTVAGLSFAIVLLAFIVAWVLVRMDRSGGEEDDEATVFGDGEDEEEFREGEERKELLPRYSCFDDEEGRGSVEEYRDEEDRTAQRLPAYRSVISL